MKIKYHNYQKFNNNKNNTHIKISEYGDSFSIE
jgi:hypothetical protein